MMLLALAVAATPIPVDAVLLDGLRETGAVLTAHGKTSICLGVLLADVSAKLGAPQGSELNGEALTWSLLATGRDGYKVRISLGELDAKLGASQAIIATWCDGKPLNDSDGPYRLVFPGEARAARSVRQLQSLTLEK